MASSHVRVKTEKKVRLPAKSVEEKELCSYLPDRIEVIKQAFSSLRSRELLAIIPPALRSVPFSTLKEMCLDEILGISTKRLRSIIDDNECPSNTDSSSEEDEKNVLDILETISLDSISSEEDDIISHGKTKSKHRKRNKEQHKQSKHGKSKDKPSVSTNEESSQKESGMTVLELLELQARARAIRAQLAAVTGGNAGASDIEISGSEDEVLIKEEQPVVVEIPSSDEEKEENNKQSKARSTTLELEKTATVETNSKNDDNSKNKSRKIKLNRKIATTSLNDKDKSKEIETIQASTSTNKSKENETVKASTSNENNEQNNITKRPNNEEKKKPKPKKYRKAAIVEEDEITLDVSECEKMDLFEISNSSVDESDSDNENKDKRNQTTQKNQEEVSDLATEENNTQNQMEEPIVEENNSEISTELDDSKEDNVNINSDLNNSETVVETISTNVEEKDKAENENISKMDTDEPEKTDEAKSENDRNVEIDKPEEKDEADQEKELSDGEVSNYSSDNVEITEIKPDIVCISDDEKPNPVEKKPKQKKKKKKQAKKETSPAKEKVGEEITVMEISDESSGEDNSNEYLSKEPTAEEIEEFSKKIDSEIEREEIVMGVNVCGDVGDEPNDEQEGQEVEEEVKEPEGPLGTWKERWLESSKVKRVIATSNLFNALRKKNKELKKKLAENAKAAEETKKDEEVPVEPAEVLPPETANVDEGSIEHYNMLTGSTKYVNPVVEQQEPNPNMESMAKDAKELMKMYKKLIKINKKKNETEAERKERREKKKKKKKEKKEKKRKNDEIDPQVKSSETNETREQIFENSSKVPEHSSENVPTVESPPNIPEVPENPIPDDTDGKFVANE